MAQQYGTPFTSGADAKVKLNLKADPTDHSDFKLSGETVSMLNQHEDSAHVLMMGITPKELSELYGGVSFNMEKLETEFQKICPDYGDSLVWDKTNYALDFAAKMAFIVGPESRSVKKPGTDKKWKFRFIIERGDAHFYGTIFVCTFKNTTPPCPQPVVENKKLVLTIKQASLLSIVMISKAVPLCLANNSILLTPLAGAIFSKQDIPKLVAEATPGAVSNKDTEGIITAIIQSCQSGGQHLPNAKCHIALVASICATNNMKDKKLRDTIISKTYKQYIASGKELDIEKFKIYSRYATGGVPAEYMPERLINLYEAAKTTGIKAAIELSKNVVASASGKA